MSDSFPQPRSSTAGEDIAIVGMSCLFPGADSPAKFWQNIVGKVDAIRDAPPDWQPELFYHPDGPAIDRSYTKRGGFLGDLCRFDPLKYGTPPSSIEGAEPDHFIALRCAYECLADAGVPGIPLNNEKTGVILGRGIFVNRGWVACFQRTFAVDQVIRVLSQLDPDRSAADLETIRRELKRNLPPANADTFPGLVHSALVGRIANRLDLKGPAYTVDAACSSSLLTVEHALRELRTGTCDSVLVGGTQVSTPAPVHIMFCHLEALSRSGKIAPFSADACGTMLGQGCGMLLLKRRSDAERDGSRIYALIKAVGVSSDGNGAGLLAPRTEGQQLSISRAYEAAGVSPRGVQLVEAHGTGIPLGDAVEINSLKECFGTPDEAGPDVALGSVKSMIGHLVPASGAASLIKTALALYHRVLPPTLNAETANADLHLDQTRFFLSNEPRPWIHGGAEPRRAGVNAFGFGGINSHAVLEEYPHPNGPASDLDQHWPCELVVISGDDRNHLTSRLRALRSWLGQSSAVALLDVASAAARWQGPCRLAIIASDLPDLTKKLEHAAQLLADPARERIQDRAGIFWYAKPLAPEGRVGFVFPGEGAQYPNMLADLCRHFTDVRHQFDLTSRALEQHNLRLSRVLFPQPASAKQVEGELFEMELAIASVTAAARGLWKLLNLLRVSADAVVGHSSGEYVALLASGCYRHQDDETLLRAIASGTETARQLCSADQVSKAVLVSVGGVRQEVLDRLLQEFAGRVVVAMDNCPHQRILVGDEETMTAILAALENQGGICQRLAWDRPYHTPAFEPASPWIARYFDSLDLQPPQIELWSCATSDRFPADVEAIRALALLQWCRPVRFTETIKAMYESGVRIFIEVGPRGNLSSFVGDILKGRKHAAIPLDVPHRNGLEQLCHAMGQLIAHGVPVAAEELYKRRSPQKLDLDQPPAPPARLAPILRLELPTLELADSVVEKWRSTGSVSSASQAAASQELVAPQAELPQPAAHAKSARAEAQPPRDPISVQAKNGQQDHRNGHGATVAGQHPINPLVMPAAPSYVQAAHTAFQNTMRQFLHTQQVVAGLHSPGQLPLAPAEGRVAGLLEPPAGVLSTAPATSGGGAPHRDAPSPAAGTPLVPPPATASRATTAAPSSQPAARHSAAVATAATLDAPLHLPFVENVLEHQDEVRVVFECELSLDKHPFLKDHTFFGRQVSLRDDAITSLSVVPLALMLEFMAEAAALLCPTEQVCAVADIQVFRWCALTRGTRTVRVKGERRSLGLVECQVIEADTDAQHTIASALVEMGVRTETLGPGRIAKLVQGPAPWPPEDLYGRIMYHGPAFQGIARVEDWGPRGVRATVRRCEDGAPGSTNALGETVLPVALIDTASQLPGLVNGNWELKGTSCRLAFPNSVQRLEVCDAAGDSSSLTAFCTADQSTGKLVSDAEIRTADGQAVLRYTGKVEELVDFPLPLYRYAFAARQHHCGRSLADLFQGIEHFEHCRIWDAPGDKLLVKSFWADVLANLILSAAERTAFARLRLAPVALADWLLCRLATKEAVRDLQALDLCLADVTVEGDGQNPLAVSTPGQQPALVSTAHTTLRGISVAGSSRELSGVGVDCRPLQAIPAEAIKDNFSDEEVAVLNRVAEASGLPVGVWQLAGMCAKQAAGKALGKHGHNVVAGLRVAAADAPSQAFSIRLSGELAEQFAGISPDGTITVHWREHEQHIICLCLLPVKARDGSSTRRIQP